MGRMMPIECPHGVIVDWGDFGGDDEKHPACPACDAIPSTADHLRSVVDAWDSWTRDDAAITWEAAMSRAIDAARSHLAPPLAASLKEGEGR